MQITLSKEQELRLRQWISPMTEAEVNAEIEPTGYSIEIEIAGPLGTWAVARKGTCVLELGEVELTMHDG